MKLVMYTNKNLHRYLAGGWNLQGMARGTIATLDGRTIEVDVPSNASMKEIKKAVEDKEGHRREDLVLYTTSGRRTEDTEKLDALGVTKETKGAGLILLLPPEDKDRPSSKDPKPAGDGLAYKPQGLVSTTMTISPGEPSPSQRSPGGAAGSPDRSSDGSPAPVHRSPAVGKGHVLGGAGIGARSPPGRRNVDASLDTARHSTAMAASGGAGAGEARGQAGPDTGNVLGGEAGGGGQGTDERRRMALAAAERRMRPGGD